MFKDLFLIILVSALQICDSDQTITSVYATPGGSNSHDVILNKHAVRIDLQSLNNSGEQCWLIGQYFI